MAAAAAVTAAAVCCDSKRGACSSTAGWLIDWLKAVGHTAPPAHSTPPACAHSGWACIFALAHSTTVPSGNSIGLGSAHIAVGCSVMHTGTQLVPPIACMRRSHSTTQRMLLPPSATAEHAADKALHHCSWPQLTREGEDLGGRLVPSGLNNQLAPSTHAHGILVLSFFLLTREGEVLSVEQAAKVLEAKRQLLLHHLVCAAGTHGQPLLNVCPWAHVQRRWQHLAASTQRHASALAELKRHTPGALPSHAARLPVAPAAASAGSRKSAV